VAPVVCQVLDRDVVSSEGVVGTEGALPAYVATSNMYTSYDFIVGRCVQSKMTNFIIECAYSLDGKKEHRLAQEFSIDIETGDFVGEKTFCMYLKDGP
jgi:hypothetical protein